MVDRPATNHASDRDDAVAKVAALVRDARSCMLTTMTGDGRHVSRPMAVQEVEFDGDLWFFTYDDSEKAAQVQQHPEVNVALADEKHSSWTSISGRASVVHDRAKAEELWAKPLEVWFPDGLETTGLALLKVETDSAEYWDSPGGRVASALAFVKSKVTGERPDVGESDTVEL